MMNQYLKTMIFGAVTVLVVSCGGGASSGSSTEPSSEKPTSTLRVWGPSQEQQYLTDVTESFKLLYPSININFELAVVGEPDLKGILLLDVPGGADVFAFPDDQLEDLVSAGALSELTQFKDDVIERNQDWTIDVASVDDKLYAYPNTSDNGIFMYYDTRHIQANEMTTLDSILAKADELDSSVIIDPMGGWAMSAWFAVPGEISWSKTTMTQTIDWNNETGLSSAIGMYNAYKTNRIQRDQGIIVTEFLENDTDVSEGIIAGISGTWNAVAIKTILGDNYAAIKLPTFTNGDGTQQQMGSMIGAKLVGVNAYTQNPGLAHAFANYLTNYENQLTKAVTMGVGPSNIAAQQNEEVQEVPSLSAIFDQAPHGILQARSVSSFFWSPAGAFADALITDARNHAENYAAWLTLPGNAGKTEEQFMTEEQIPLLQEYLDIFIEGVLAVNEA
jgi:arabinogalactan oligomer / maltooligosaccharide transport system substrate-binding protein